MDTPLISQFEHKGWSFKCTKAPMLNTEQLAEFTDTVNFVGALPECLFGYNSLELKNENKNCKISFLPREALLGCLLQSETKKFDTFTPKVPQVRFAESWKASQKETDNISKVIETNRDWTFSTGYRGSVNCLQGDELVIKHIIEEPTEEELLPMDKLSNTNDPILWYEKLEFWLDDLSDCGVSQCDCKIRVNDNFWYLLFRFEMRVDHVLVRRVETRLFHDFDTNHVIQEFRWKEVPVSTVEEREEDQRQFDECVHEEDTKFKELARFELRL